MSTISRPPSPWPGSSYETRHRWQLDDVRSLDEAAVRLLILATELDAAAAAGWTLLEPLRGGHVLARRPSRRQRARQESRLDAEPGRPPALPPWRARLVDEPPVPGDVVLDVAAAPSTPVLAVLDGGAVQQLRGPAVEPAVLARLLEQFAPAHLGARAWGVAPARVGPVADLVADGSALRLHAVAGGVLVRTVEVLAFSHAADRAVDLRDAAASYRRLAEVLRLCAAAGGRLDAVDDDGLVHVVYPR